MLAVGAIIYLEEKSQRNAVEMERVYQTLASHPCLELGEATEVSIPIAAITSGRREDKALWGWVQELAGVGHIDIVFAAEEDEEQNEKVDEEADKTASQEKKSGVQS